MRIHLTLGYIGTAYAGWQRQKNKDTVQQRVEDAIHAVDPAASGLYGSGRTDAGVHAVGQSAHFDAALKLDGLAWRSALNCHLPPDIRVVSAKKVPDSFHARADAAHKTYRYLMYTAETERAEHFGRAVHIGPQIDLAAMRSAAAMFIGTHDFKAFQSAGSSAKTTVRTVFRTRVIKGAGGLLIFEVCADGFLYHMVRRMAAALLYAGRGRLSPQDIASAFDNPASYMVHYVAPAHGLYLYAVSYKQKRVVQKETPAEGL